MQQYEVTLKGDTQLLQEPRTTQPMIVEEIKHKRTHITNTRTKQHLLNSEIFKY